MSTITVHVTQQDIDAGERGKCGRCPVALALNRHIAPEQAIVLGRRWQVMDAEPVVRYRLPLRASVWIFDFDEGLPVAPFTFRTVVAP